jgi:putative ABC transport system permease protein
MKSLPFGHLLRSARRSPGFVLAGVAILAPTIGAATAMFSIVDAVLVRGTPYPDLQHLKVVFESSDNGNGRTPSYPTVRDWRAQLGSSDDVIADAAFVRGNGVMFPGPDGPTRETAAYVGPEFFRVMGARPLLGRLLTDDDERYDAPPVAVLSYDYFEREFNGDRSALGRTIMIDSVATHVIGVMPRGFAYPNFVGGGGWLPPAAWQPFPIFQRISNALSLRGLHADSRTVVRLRAGADSARAAAVLATIERRLATEYPTDQAHWTSVGFLDLSVEMFGQLRTTLILIFGAVTLLIVLACANVANLLLVRAGVRDRELAIRAALGADQWRLVGLVLADSVLISVVAGTIGLLLARTALSFVRVYASSRLPFATDFVIDARATAFIVALTTASALLVAAFPATHAARGKLAERIRGGSASSGTGAAGRRVRGGLLSVQLALTIAVLIGAGLLVQSVRRLAAVDLGYDANGLVSFMVTPSPRRYGQPADAAALYKRIIDATRRVPTVELSAAAGRAIFQTKVETDEQRGAATPPTAFYHTISEDYFRLLGVHIVAGRDFTEADMRSPMSAGFIITQNLAKHLWPNVTPLAKRVTVYRQSQARADFGQPITMPVIGVVADYRQFGQSQDPPEQIFLPYTLEVWPWMVFELRSTRAAGVLTSITKAVQSVDPTIDFRGKPAVEATSESFSDPRFFLMTLMSAFAIVALVLSAIGLYGVVSYGAAQRTRELAIRIAIGATKRRVLALVVADLASFFVVGTVGGLALAFVSSKVLRSMLFDTTPSDPVTFVVVPVALGIVAAMASLLPAYRAAMTDPLIVLRAE